LINLRVGSSQLARQPAHPESISRLESRFVRPHQPTLRALDAFTDLYFQTPGDAQFLSSKLACNPHVNVIGNRSVRAILSLRMVSQLMISLGM
jgi:hypothetical protein